MSTDAQIAGTTTKAQLAEALYDKLGGLSKREAADIVDSTFEILKTTLERGDKVKLSGFGNFSVRYKKARVGRNPASKEPMTISERHVVTFKPSPRLKDLVNEAVSPES